MKYKKKLIGRMVQVVLRIPPDIDEKTRKIALEEHRSYSSVLRQAIINWLKAREGK